MKKILYATSIILIILAGCKKDVSDYSTNTDPTVNSILDLEVEGNFDWSNNTKVFVRAEALSNNGSPLSGVRFEVYLQDPGEGEDAADMRVSTASGMTNSQGIFETTIHVPAFQESIYIKPLYIGLEDKQEVIISSGNAFCTFGGNSRKGFTPGKSGSNKVAGKSWLTIGTWNSNGVPNYLESNGDIITQDFLDDVNASLPEYQSLPESHPQYLASGNDADIILQDSAEIWVTFVHEGAGYKNALGYFTYPTNSPPSSVSDVSDYTIIFPNVSASGSGGGLYSGDKVYLGKFAPGTSVGWFLIANGWSSSSQSVTNGTHILYSQPGFNPETDPAKQQHNVLLHDEERDILLLGFEDLVRSGWCDNDFNDAIFYATVTPITAVLTSGLPPMDSPEDWDGDGTTNVFDEYPWDSTKAFNSYYPSETQFGSMAFEDLWPYRGDYDFNDLVIDYRFNQISNSSNKIVEIEAEIVVRAIGAGYHNGFGFMMDLLPSDIESVSGYSLQNGIVSLSSNGTESGQSNATIVVFDDAYDILPFQGGNYVNTVEGQTYVEPDTMNIVITLSSQKTIAEIGYPPYNPFIFINQTRNRELHLPGYPPTDLVATSFFGTGDDDTNPASGKYYKSKTNLPWGMNVPEKFRYPKEKNQIIHAHLVFGTWAQSSGFSFMDWYQDKPGYRDNTKIFNKNN